MSFGAVEEQIVRESIATQIALISEAGFVIPSPLYVNDIAEFWATLDNSKDTKAEIEIEPIAGCWLYPLGFTDDFTSGGIDSPLINLKYGIYLFRQYGLEREDETETPDVWNSQVLKAHNDFISAWLQIKASFQGKRNIAGLDPAIFATVKTTSVVQTEDIQNQALCEFVPGAVGFAVRLDETVEVKLIQC